MRLTSRVLAAGALVALAARPAAADESLAPLPQPSAAGSNAVGACLETGQVWLFVVDEQQRVLSNQCVGTPASGEDALRLAGLATTDTRGGYICTIGGHPEECPARFEGEFWNYHHAAAGERWVYSDTGAVEHRPAGGTIEGWCYNDEDESRCTMPNLRVVIDGEARIPSGVAEADLIEPAPVILAPLPPPPPIPWTTVAGIGAVVALGGPALFVARRRGETQEAADDELGGR